MNIYSHQKINVSGTSHRDLSAKIRELDRASTIANFERAQISFFIGDRFGIELGRVRKPFGFWDDYYSLFRNLMRLENGSCISWRCPEKSRSGSRGIRQGHGRLVLDPSANVCLHDVGRDKKGISLRGAQ